MGIFLKIGFWSHLWGDVKGFKQAQEDGNFGAVRSIPCAQCGQIMADFAATHAASKITGHIGECY